MKRIFAILLLLFIPTFVWAGDACTNPSEYTIDKRCYVTDEQKQQKPYNAVVGIINKYDEIDCTGTIVRVNDKLFLYTAKHCALYLFTKVSKNLKFKTIDNQEIMADLLTSGDFVEDWFGEYENPDGDWAVYSFKEQNIPFVNISDKNTDDKSFSVGYGTLKILNDKQIKNIKKQYFEYMRKGENQYGEKVRLNKTEDPEWGIVSNGGLKTNHPSVDVFIQRYFSDEYFSDNNALKVSFCKYTADNKVTGCQGWTGDSGGGLFDSDGNIMAIRSTGKAIIGGDNHASVKDEDGFIKIPSAQKD